MRTGEAAKYLGITVGHFRNLRNNFGVAPEGIRVFTPSGFEWQYSKEALDKFRANYPFRRNKNRGKVA